MSASATGPATDPGPAGRADAAGSADAALAEALAACLAEIDDGADPEAALARHADRAAQLRPLVAAALVIRRHRPRR